MSQARFSDGGRLAVSRLTLFLASLIAIFLLAAALRFFRLDFQSFWNDEGNSARLSERSVALILQGTASDVHPPLYYLLLHGWRGLMGESEFALRALSAFFGVGLVALIVSLGHTLLGDQGQTASLLAAGLAAVNPALVYYSQEARMYEMLAFLAVLSTLLLVRWLSRSGGRIAAGGLWYVLSVVAGLYTHYFFPAVLAAHLLTVAWRFLWRRRTAGELNLAFGLRWLAAVAIAGALYLPWLPIFLRQAGSRAATRVALPDFLWDGGRWLAFGQTVRDEAVRWPFLAIVALLVLSVWALWREEARSRTHRWPSIAVLLPGVYVPIGLMWILGTTRPAFYKFMLMAVPGLCLLLAFGWYWVWRVFRSTRLGHSFRIVATSLLLVALAGSSRSLWGLYFDPTYARADYRGMAARIAAEAHPDAGVVLDAPNQWEVFTYYHRRGAPVYPIPMGNPDAALINAELDEIAGEHDRLYALFWGEAERDPEHLVERWLNAHAFKAGDEWVGDVRFVTYGVGQAATIDEARPVGLNFGQHIVLERYALYSSQVAAGEILRLTLFWKTTEALATRYKVFLHLTDEAGRLVAQRDAEPGGGLALTTTWRPGETIVDNHGLQVPATTPEGRYNLLLGLYDIANPADRLPVATDEGPLTARKLADVDVTAG